jgi:hypothetical protein
MFAVFIFISKCCTFHFISLLGFFYIWCIFEISLFHIHGDIFILFYHILLLLLGIILLLYDDVSITQSNSNTYWGNHKISISVCVFTITLKHLMPCHEGKSNMV